MRVGVPRETAAGERRVALVPEAIARLDGITVSVERGAGAAAGFTDAAYEEAGAELVDDAWQGVDGVVKVAKPTADELAKLRAGELLIAFLQPLTDRELIERLAARGRARLRDGVDPADDARAADGRALVAGDRRPATRPCCSPPSDCRVSSRC